MWDMVVRFCGDFSIKNNLCQFLSHSIYLPTVFAALNLQDIDWTKHFEKQNTSFYFTLVFNENSCNNLTNLNHKISKN